MTTTTARMRGWTITHTTGARLAQIRDPQGYLIEAVEPVAWEWEPIEGGASRATREATREDLVSLLLAYLDGDEEGSGAPQTVTHHSLCPCSTARGCFWFREDTGECIACECSYCF